MISVNNKRISITLYETTNHNNPYAQFFPTRDGKGSSSLSSTINNPSNESLSKNKSLLETATVAREELDKQYNEMKNTGKAFSYDSREGEDWYTLFKNFDRRSLYAVSSNQNGKFSKQEQNIANTIMSQQQGLAMGLYSGPSRLEKNFAKFAQDEPVNQLKCGLAFLKQVSAEEKLSKLWKDEHSSIVDLLEYLKKNK